MKEAEKVYQLLKELEIEYERHDHPPVTTIEDIKALEVSIEPLHCKNLFLRNSKGDRHYLALVHPNKKANTRAIAKKIASTRLSFASDARLKKHLGLDPGGVSVFGLINDPRGTVTVLVDRDLEQEEKLTFHPNDNRASITLSYRDFMRFLDRQKNPVRFIEME